MIIDMQKAYYGGPTVSQMDAAAEYINAVIPFFREKGYRSYGSITKMRKMARFRETRSTNLLTC